MTDLLEVGQAQRHYNAAGTRVLKYTVEMLHKGLNEHKLISAPELDMLQNKANIQANKWEEKWNTIENKKQIAAQKEANAEEAQRQSEEAQNAVSVIDNLLIHTLSVDDTISWESLKKFDSFPNKKPPKPKPPKHPQIPKMPQKDEPIYTPTFTFFEKILKGLKEKKIAQYEELYNDALNIWEKEKQATEKTIFEMTKTYETVISEWEGNVENWEKSKINFLSKQDEHNAKIDEMEKAYLEKNPVSIVEYCELVLNNSEYPDNFPKDFEIEYNPDTNILIVEYQLPNLECMPNIKEVKYLASKNELKTTNIPEAQISKMFDDAIYKISLRTIHELFEADAAKAIEAISFNGWVRSINKGTGKEENNCIISLQVKKDDFIQIDLAQVDPKICFKTLKGVCGSKLSSLTPIQPILQIEKNDKRFVESYNVGDNIDTSTNLAAMDWEDFEHLIRELFEKEFKTSGGEVKVTQASRDGGVDAVAFDPDPIRGGKIVIQAKRDTNTVGVSAVRDLYGTVMNEGATKGILVSTADYGPDAYEFVKGKPLTLLSGSNLLHLLQKHGHHAKIDLKEAKKILAEREK